MSLRIAGTGSFLPNNKVSNDDLSKVVETSDEWIFERTGIRNRRIAEAQIATSDLAYEASLKALEAAQLSADSLDAILVATVTPDHCIPSTACLLQARLGCRSIFALDISAACSGFIYGLTVADALIKTGNFQNILLIGAETLSRITNFEDRQTCVLFGDGAGAVILSKTDKENSLMYSHVSSIGDVNGYLAVPAGGSRQPVTKEILETKSNSIHMNGRAVFKNAVEKLNLESKMALEATKLSISDIDWALFHQANLRIIDKVADDLGIPAEKILKNIEETGNTSSASIPILFDQSIRDNVIKRDNLILLSAFGAGLTAGAAVIRY